MLRYSQARPRDHLRKESNYLKETSSVIIIVLAVSKDDVATKTVVLISRVTLSFFLIETFICVSIRHTWCMQEFELVNADEEILLLMSGFPNDLTVSKRLVIQ